MKSTGCLSKSEITSTVGRLKQTGKRMRKAVSLGALAEHHEPEGDHDQSDLEHLQCTICYEIRDGAIFQCREGHLICTTCLEAYQRQAKKACPSCKVPMLEQIRSRAVEEQIGRLPVLCTHCRQTFKRCTVGPHQATCPKRVVQCGAAEADCTWKGPFEALRSHERECKHMGILCVAQRISRYLIEQNRDKMTELEERVKDLSTDKTNLKSELLLANEQLERGQKKVSLLVFISNWAGIMLVFATVVGVAAGVVSPAPTALEATETAQPCAASHSHEMLHAAAVERYLGAKGVAMGAMGVVGVWLSVVRRWEWPWLKCIGITLGAHHIFTAVLYLLNLVSVWQHSSSDAKSIASIA